MDLGSIITETRQIVQQTDSNNSQASDATITGWANDCTIQLCSTLSALPKEVFSSVVAAATITLDTDLIKLDFASISDGTTSFPLETMDFNSFVRRYPDYQNQPTGKPTLIYRMTNTTWNMFPAPDATWTGKSLTLIGSAVPTAMSATTDVPPFSQVMHPAYPHYCAWKFFLLLNNPQRAADEYAIFDGIKKMNTFTTTNTRGSLLSFKVK